MIENSVLIFGAAIPDYVFYLIGIAVAFIIYASLSSEKRHKTDIFLKRFGIWILLIVLWAFFFNRLGNFDYGTLWNIRANTLFIFLGFVIGIFKLIRFKQKYHSTMAICDNMSGSCASYEFAEDMVILNIGTTNSGWFPKTHGDMLWIGPRRHFKKINNTFDAAKSQIFLKTRLSRADPDEIPTYAYDKLISNPHYNKDNIYYGLFSEEELNDSSIKIKGEKDERFTPSTWEIRDRDSNRTLNHTRALIKGDLSFLRKFVSEAGIIKKKAEGKQGFNVGGGTGSQQQTEQ